MAYLPFAKRRGLRVLAAYLAACCSIAAASFLIGLILSHANIVNLSMLYLVPVLGLAIVFGRGPAVFASILAFFTYNWFFIQPLHTFNIYNPAEWLALMLFLLVAIVCSELATNLKRRTEEAEHREQEARWLHELSEQLSTPSLMQEEGLSDVAGWLTKHLNLGAAGVSVASSGIREDLEGQAGEPKAHSYLMRAPRESPASRQVLTTRNASPGVLPRPRWIRLNRGLPKPQGDPWEVYTVPLTTVNERVGTLRLVQAVGAALFTAQQDQLLLSAATQIAQAVERARLQSSATEAAALRRADELKTALLDSVSHDLRTPLAGIKAAAGSLRQKDVQWAEADRDGFAASIEQEADRLDRLVGHLLDLSRIESGSLQPEREWHVLSALVDDVVERLKPLLVGRPLTVDVPAELPPVPLDYVQISEVLTNLLENAAKYTSSDSHIAIAAWMENNAVTVRITDAGPGIPAEVLPRVFDKFYRVESAPGRRSRGSGLGLAVARGLVEAHGGHIWAESVMGQGTSFLFSLPLEEHHILLESENEAI